jgi:predicted ester cyclase
LSVIGALRVFWSCFLNRSSRQPEQHAYEGHLEPRQAVWPESGGGAISADIKANAIRMIEEVWNRRHLDVVDELVAPTYVHHDPNTPDSEQPTGPEAYKRLIRQYLKAFPDLRFTEHDVIALGEFVAGRWTCSGTHLGQLGGLVATGLRNDYNGHVHQSLCRRESG